MTTSVPSPPATDNQVRGRAVYLEFVKQIGGDPYTQQIFILPEGLATSHKTVPMTVFRRRISSAQPRKTWKMTSASMTSGSSRGSRGVLGSDELIAQDMTSFLMPLFKSLTTNSYTLYKQPIVVEVTAEDLELARNGKTPYKALARVWKSRKALGFPKEYIHSVIPEPAAVTF